MTRPLNESEVNQAAWNRKAKDGVNSIIRRLMGIGATTERPNNPTDGQMFYDQTLKIPIWWNSADAVWKNAAGTGV